MITKFDSLYAGHVDMENVGYAGVRHKRPLLLERAPGDRLRQDRSDRQDPRPARIRHLLARRAPLPARGLRVHPEHPHGCRASRARYREHQNRLRLQHRPDVAPAAARRGLRDCRHPHKRQDRLRSRARLSHPRSGHLRLASAGPGGQPQPLRGAGGDHLQVVQRGVVLPPGRVLHDPARGAVQGLHPEGDHGRPTPG